MDELEPVRGAADARTDSGRHVRGVLVTVALSLVAAYGGAKAFGVAARCYGPGGGADACAAEALVFAGGCFATMLIPFVFAAWAGRTRDRRVVRTRLLVCLAGYLVPLALLLPLLV